MGAAQAALKLATITVNISSPRRGARESEGARAEAASERDAVEQGVGRAGMPSFDDPAALVLNN